MELRIEGVSKQFDGAPALHPIDLAIPSGQLLALLAQLIVDHRQENGNFKKYESAGDAMADTLEVMRKLTPSHIVFNGAVGALTGEHALQAAVGEKVLIVHSQANRDTRPHLIGGHGDYVWATGKFRNPPDLDQETWFIPGGTAGAAFYTFEQPGIYAYVNHNLIEACELGAAAHFKVTGEWNNSLMQAVLAPSSI